jgi:hypothetical protein
MKIREPEIIPKFWTDDRLYLLKKNALIPPIHLANLFKVPFHEFKKLLKESNEAYFIVTNARASLLTETINNLRKNSDNGCFSSARFLLSLYQGDSAESLEEQLGTNTMNAEQLKHEIKQLIQSNPEMLMDNE